MSVQLLFQIITEVCLPLFAVVGLGWFMDRRFGLNLETLVKLNIYVLVPCFIFTRLMDTPMSGHEAGRIMLSTALMVLGCGLLASIASRALGLDHTTRRSLALASMFPNSGNFGLPLVALAFGHAAASVQVYVLVVVNVSTFTVGLFLASGTAGGAGGHRRALLSTLRQPAIYAVAAAALCKAMNLPVQKITALWQPMNMMAGALVGVALFTLGTQLSKTRPTGLTRPLGAALAIRLAAGPLLAWGLSSVLEFPPPVAAVLILSAGSPTAVNTALLAHEFGGNAPFATASVYYSTLTSLLSTSISLAVLRAWLG